MGVGVGEGGGCIYMYVCANVYKYTREFNNNKVFG